MTGCSEAADIERRQVEEEERRFPWLLGLLALGGGYAIYRHSKKKRGAK